jgi:hypothetical protein
VTRLGFVTPFPGVWGMNGARPHPAGCASILARERAFRIAIRG